MKKTLFICTLLIFFAGFGGKTGEFVTVTNNYKVVLFNGEEGVLKRLNANNLIRAYSLNSNVFAQYTADDTNQPYMKTAEYHWGQDYIHLSAAWATVGTPTYSPIVAILDSGIDLTHPDLSANIWVNPGETKDNRDDDGNGYIDDVNGYNFVDNNAGCTDDYGHGTMIAGIIGAVKGNNQGLSGICPTVRMMSVKVLDHQGEGKADNVIKGIFYAVANGADIINISFAQEKPSPVLETALEYAYRKGIVIIAAAGNYGVSTPYYPAYSKYTISVAAMNTNGYISSMSNYGDYIDVLAPGIDIYSTYPGSDPTKLYAVKDGTSLAAGFVSGVAALVKAYKPELKNNDIIHIILNGTSNSEKFVQGEKGIYGYGTLDAAKAVSMAASYNYSSQISKTYAYPNPFVLSKHKLVKILGIPTDESSSVEIFDVSGRRVRTLDDHYSEIDSAAGTALWDGKNDYGQLVGSGVYFYYIKSNQSGQKGTITVVR